MFLNYSRYVRTLPKPGHWGARPYLPSVTPLNHMIYIKLKKFDNSLIIFFQSLVVVQKIDQKVLHKCF